jgi:hypothetical protein
MVFRIVCAYCGRDLGTKEAQSNSVAETLEKIGLPMVSHSICPVCFEREMVSIRSRRKEGDDE